MKIPACVGVIMDGNRRWAKAQGLPTFAGHSQGYETLKSFLKWAKKLDIRNVIAFAFSTENWNRSQEEVGFLLGLMRKVIAEEIQTFVDEKVRIHFIGDLSRFPEDIVAGMKQIEKDTEGFPDFNLAIAVSYGGKEEILQSVNASIKEGKTEITKQDIESHLYTKHIPAPDMIIRTSGEMRLSGFLLWQSEYSELFFTQTLWPDFSEAEFVSMVEEYERRERRMGV